MAQSRLRQLAKYLHPYWRNLLAGMIALLLVNILGVSIPLIIRDTIDQLRESFSFDLIVKYALIIFVLASVMWVIRMYSRITVFGVGRQVEFDLKQKLFEHLLQLEPDYFAINTSGDLMNRATSDVDNIRRLVGFAILSLANTIFAYGLTLPAMLGINVKLTLIAISVYPLMLIVVQLFSGKLRDLQREVQENLSDLSELVQEDVSGIALIKIYAQEENERRAFKEKNNRLLNSNLKLARTRNFLFPLIEGIAYLSLLLLLWLGTSAIARGEITIGDLVALIIFVERLVFPTALLGFTITAYQRGEVSVDRIETVLQAQPKIKDKNFVQSIAISEVKGKITARNLTYTYPGAKQPALDSVSFTVQPGETVAIVGSIGAGKSTIAKAIPRLLDIQPGQLLLDDIDITDWQLSQLRRAIACVPQESFLFSTTVKNNIRYGEPFAEQFQVELAAKEAQIHEEIINFPKKYETLVGERGITLSGGQRQRIALARALLIDAPILILDDALSSVDNQTATQILNNLSTEIAKKTVIFISHQLSAAATADRILVIERGKIVQTGTHAELIKQKGLYQSLWQQHQLKAALE
ncbi:MAG: ABC transporter ATP-binding protein [Cyanobacteria bacterium J083]|nr:MAG: ABC transporter ATP-binding protein [Cyanobacteria bacterium J083]